MKSIDIFYQGEGIREIAHFEAEPGRTASPSSRAALIEKHGLDEETLIFLEDRDEPIDESCCSRTTPATPASRSTSAPLPARGGGGDVQRRDGAPPVRARARPSRGSRRWAAEHKFGMTDAGGRRARAADRRHQGPAGPGHASRRDRVLPGLHASPSISSPNERVNGLAERRDESPGRAGFPRRTSESPPSASRRRKAAGTSSASPGPTCLIAVTAADGREYVLRFNCAGYPQQPPTGGPWDLETERKCSPSTAGRAARAGACRHGLSHRLEGRHRALPALRPRKHRRPRQLAARDAVENLAASRRHQSVPGACS